MGAVIRAGVIVVVLLSSVGSGMAAAEPVPLPDVTQTASTVDGWLVRASLTGMTLNSVPNMADTFYTREAFVSGTAIATIEGNGKVPVNSGTLALGLQLGCQTDLSLGGTVGLAPTMLFVVPVFSVIIKPGNITNVGLGQKSLQGRNGQISQHEAHIKFDGCSGPVSARFVAVASMSTSHSDDTVTTYGGIVQL